MFNIYNRSQRCAPQPFAAMFKFSLENLNLVGSSGLEPPTSRLSGVRSNQLSYEPIYQFPSPVLAITLFIFLPELPQSPKATADDFVGKGVET